MSLYMALHNHRTSPAAYAVAFSQEALMKLAVANASGTWPAHLVRTWDPSAYGRVDPIVCLWEATRPEDITAVLHAAGLDVHLTADIMQVDEIDWAQLALAAG
jgi:hypothetical protein